MKKLLLKICWIIFFLSSSYSYFIFENKTVENPLLKYEDIIRLIKEYKIFPIYLQNGSILFYNLSSKEFVEKIVYGNLTLISNLSKGLGDVILNEEDLNLWREIFVLRNLSNDFDLELLKEEDYLLYQYIKNRYGSLEEFLRDILKQQGLESFDLKSIEEFLEKNYEIDPIYDYRSIYKSILDKKIGYSQYYKILKELVKDERIIKEFSKLYKDPLFRELIKKLPKDIKKEILKELIKELINDKNFRLLNKIAKNIDKETLLKILRDILREVMTSEEIKEIYKEIVKDLGKDFMNYIKTNWGDILKIIYNYIKSFIGEWGIEILCLILLMIVIYLIKA